MASLPRSRRRPVFPVVAAVGMVLLAGVAGCAPEPGSGGATPTSSASVSGSDAQSSGSPSPTPSASATVEAEIPTDCAAMLSDDVLAQLEGIPLNDPAFGPSGLQSNGTLICVWADPAADTTGLHTGISSMARGPALDMLNDLADTQGYTCYTPDGGTRCEKTWENGTYPVTDGRTLFWRDGILIDTTYSNLAPEGYTASIVEHIWG